MIGRIIVQNPDASSPIQKVQLIIFVPRDTLISYQYFRNGEIYRYELDIEADRYVRKFLTDEEKTGCMKCHEKIKAKIQSQINADEHRWKNIIYENQRQKRRALWDLI